MASVVLPGDIIAPTDVNLNLKLGPGVKSTTFATDKIFSTKAGVLGQQKTSTTESIWVESLSKRYTPAVGEPVIGVITARNAEGYRVDIGSSQTATLDALAFEGATKRSRPNLKIGALVYARVSLAHSFAEPELECYEPVSQKSAGFGQLADGMLIRNVELSKCRALLSTAHSILPSLGQQVPYEVAVGMNGRVWIKAANVEKTLHLINKINEA